MAKKKTAKKKSKKRAKNYESKLAITGTLEDVLKVSIASDKRNNGTVMTVGRGITSTAVKRSLRL